ncbi:MAG: 30S ribosomal protein S13 [Planctomycetota bacterium]|nr:30S ribosomal protein S13 [Planctomycetota bacterium]MDI6787487.1 30S ribosomal protein S13 [Planctomycetota bacterium]
MARIAGVEIPSAKRIEVGLAYIYGIGLVTSRRVLKEAGIDPNIRVKNLTEEQISKLNIEIDKHYTVEGALRRQIVQNIQRLKDIGSYRGLRHRKGLPVRGQRTRSNARTRKGPRKTVAGRKMAAEKT